MLWPLLAAAPAVAIPLLFIAVSWRTNGTNGLPLDDSWIHIRYADNLAKGYGLSLNKGDPTPGETAPGWAAIIALADWLGLPPVGAAQGLSIALNALAAWAAYQLARRLMPRQLALAAAALVACSGALAWSAAGALEVGLFNVLALHAIRLHVLNRRQRWPLALQQAGLLGLAAWARPEVLGLAVVLVAAQAWRLRGWGRWLAQGICQLAIAVAIAAPYAWFSYATTGRLLPTTFYVKAGAPFSWAFVWECVMRARAALAQDSRLLAAAVVVGAAALLLDARCRRRGLALAGWVFGLPVAYGLIGNTEAGANFGRHFYILFPMATLLSLMGLRWLAAQAPGRGAVVRIGAAILALDLLAGAWARAGLFVLNVRDIQRMQFAAAAWILGHVPRGATVAVNDIGVISYVADRPVIDLRGIATPEALDFLERYGRPGEPARDSGALEFIRRVRPDYLAVFPDWYPRTLAELSKQGVFERITSITNADNVTCGSDVMVIARLHWDR